MKKKILVLQKQAPYGSSMARDGLDYVLTSAAYDQDISVAFIAEGVWQLVSDQRPEGIAQKSQSAALEVLSLYDVEDLYVCEEDLIERGLKLDQLAVQVKSLSREQIKQLIHEQDAVIGF